jgi:Ca-activated chloride channel homolog
MQLNRFSVSKLIALIFLLSLGAIMVHAQGVIIPRPCERPESRCPPPPQVWPQVPRTLKVKSIRFNTKINDQAAVTRVEQVFTNDTPYTLEGTYFFPLPDDVSITEFAMWDGDKRLVGEVRSREEARRIYNEIVRSRRDPALLEYAGKNLFQASIFPINPHSEKKIELTYSQVLRNEGGTVSYRYPLGIGWRAQGIVAPAPPPRPLPMPRREYPTPHSNNPAPSSIAAQIEINSRLPLKGLYSPSHQIEIKRDGEHKARVSFETNAQSGQADFQLFYTLSAQDFGASLLTYREPGKDGYFLLLVAPKAQLDEREVVAKDIIFVLDTSGSMADAGKMDKAKAALRHGVEQLDARDRFNIISFAGEEHLMSERPLNADKDAKQQARDFIEKMRPTGGTNINDAVLAACKQVQRGERPQLIVLITDGQPTVGETQAPRIMANVQKANGATARLFTFGVGYDVNTVLLDGLANDNRGTVEYIEPNEDIEIKVSNFFTKVNHPVLSDVQIDWGGLDTELVYPRTMPDIFHGSQLVLVGRYRVANKRAAVDDKSSRAPSFVNSYAANGTATFDANKIVRLTLTGKVNGRQRRFVYDELRFPEKQTEHEFLPHLWAMRRVGHLLNQIKLNGESKELRDEIVELGTRYGIVTPYTSALVLEPNTRLISIEGRPGGRQVERQAEMVTVTPMSPVAGGQAVADSKAKESLRRAEMVPAPPPPSAQMRQVGGKTFYLRDGAWTDSEYKTDANLPLIKLKFASDEYFKLINQEPKFGEWFALGERVVVVWQGKLYRVEE